MKNESILLDTHAAIWLQMDRLSKESIDAIIDAGLAATLFVSPITAWEIGLLADRSRSKQQVKLIDDPATWYRQLLGTSLLQECPFNGQIALEATQLPGVFHADPADRFLVATARFLDCALMTRDGAILDYAAKGHVRAIEC